jgi:hypothetical protein
VGELSAGPGALLEVVLEVLGVTRVEEDTEASVEDTEASVEDTEASVDDGEEAVEEREPLDHEDPNGASACDASTAELVDESGLWWTSVASSPLRRRIAHENTTLGGENSLTTRTQ